MSLSLVPWAIIAVLAAIAGLLFWQWSNAREKIGALETTNAQLTLTIKEKQNALDERARTESDVRSLAPDAVRDRLR